MRNRLPLNALRAFESSARHLNFTRAGLELRVTQAAVSQQVRMLEEQLGIQLFRRLPRGLDLTEEGQALLPVLSDAFDRIEAVLQQFEGGHFHEVLTVAVVGTFAVGWLMPRLAAFRTAHPVYRSAGAHPQQPGQSVGRRHGFRHPLRRRALARHLQYQAVRRAADGALPAGGRRAPAHAAGSAARAADAHLPQGMNGSAGSRRHR